MSNTSTKGPSEDGFTELFKLQAMAIMREMNADFLGKVAKVTPPTVSVQPLALTVSGGKKQAMVESVMVIIPPIKIDGKTPKISLKVGDNVACGVFDHDTTHYNGKNEFRQMMKTPHSISNSFVIGKIAEVGDFSGN